MTRLSQGRPRISVFTSCYNRVATLHRTRDSLESQTFRGFEWILVDDGSTDGTPDLIRKFAKDSDFAVKTVIQGHLGKPAATNRAIAIAEGEFFIHADSDDAFEPDAFERLLAHWETIPSERRAEFAGVTCRSRDQLGNVDGEEFFPVPFDASFPDVYFKFGIRNAQWDLVRMDVLRQYPFPEVDYIVPETVVWHAIGKSFKTRHVNDVLLIYYRDTLDSVSNSRQMRYNAGCAYAMASRLNHQMSYFRYDPFGFIKGFVDYARWSLHAQKGLVAAAFELRSWRKLPFFVLYPLALAVAIKDRAQHKVDQAPYIPEFLPRG